MKRTNFLKPLLIVSTFLWFGCSSKDNKSKDNISEEVIKDSVSIRDIILLPTNADKYNEAVAQATQIKDSIDAVITNMKSIVNYDSLKVNGGLNIFNITINEMLLAKNRLDLDLDKIIIYDLTKSVKKLNTVTTQMAARKDELNRFTQRIQTIANSIKTLVDITTFLAGNGYLKSLSAKPASGQ
jgi:predicted MPP superfamily phosphohydrolase